MPTSSRHPNSNMEQEWTRSDPRYRQVARAVIGALILSGVFSLYSFITKEIPALYVTEPWQDDPYDALRSFDFIAIPVPAVLATWRFLLSTTSTTAPVQRIIDLARTSYLLTGLVLLVIASEWLSVLLRTRVADWTITTHVIFGVLTVLTLATLAVLALLTIARKTLASTPAPGHPDWLDDGVYFLRVAARPLPLARRPILAAADWIERVAANWIRRYPLTFLATIAIFLALGGDAHQVISEHYGVGFAIYFLTVSATGYYAFFAIVSRYLNLIAIPPFAHHPARLIGVTVAASIPLTEAFRQYLSWIIGLHGDITTASQLYALTAVIAAGTATMTLLICLIIKATANHDTN